MMMFETLKHVPKTEKYCCGMFLKIIVSFVLTRPFGKDIETLRSTFISNVKLRFEVRRLLFSIRT